MGNLLHLEKSQIDSGAILGRDCSQICYSLSFYPPKVKELIVDFILVGFNVSGRDAGHVRLAFR